MTENKKVSLAELNRTRTTDKVKDSLSYLKRGNSPINIKSVCERAGISRKTIYNRPDLKLMIEEAQSYRNDSNSSKIVEKKPKGSVQAERIEKLRVKNKQLIEDKKAILEQNMILTKENTSLKRRIYDLEELLQKQKNLNVIHSNKMKE